MDHAPVRPGLQDRDAALDALARRFSCGPAEFATSPLYGQLCTAAAADRETLALLLERRPGVQPTNLLMAAVHYSLLQDPAHPLAQWFPSVAGPVRTVGTAGGVAAAFRRFCRDRREELGRTIRTRLVQTNVVKRSTALRLALTGIDPGRPVTLIEIGASAGLLLRFDAYGGRLGDRPFGDRGSAVQIHTEWRSEQPVPELDPIPHIGARIGIDLHPIDARDADERRWLRALVWPENGAQADLLTAALDAMAARPVELVAGAAAQRLPAVIDRVPAGAPVVIFHAATMAHVPPDQRAGLIGAIEAAGQDRELFHIAMEGTFGADSLWKPAFDLRFTHLHAGHRTERLLAHMDGHGNWIAPA